MSARLVLANLLSFALQTTMLVGLGAALARVFRVDAPKALLGYWRTLLLAVVILPFCQPWIVSTPLPLVATPMTTASAGNAPAGDVSLSVTTPSPARIIRAAILPLVAAGIIARVLWLIVGAFGLRRLRRDARPLEPLPESVRRAQEQTGTAAAMFVSERVSGPLTYGVVSPVVMFPPSVSAMPPHVQNAIACHELLHVRRRDWLHEIAEEGVRCALWFHPAIWWLIGRIRLAREEVVDQAAIQLTESRERYVESLLAVAVSRSRVTFTPASAFFRRRLLKKRIARILQESTMTTRRLIAAFTASAATLSLATLFTVRTFPLEAQSREVAAATGAPIQVVRGGEHLLHGEVPEYPERAAKEKVEGDVVVDMTLNDRGEVSDARVLSGPEALRKATLEAVLQWHYSPDALSSTDTQATLRFRVPPAGVQTAEFRGKAYLVGEEAGWVVRRKIESEAQLAEHRLIEISKALEEPETTPAQRAELEEKAVETKRLLENVRVESHERPIQIEPEELHAALERKVVALAERERGAGEQPETLRLTRVRSERVSEATIKELLTHAGVSVGDQITRETIERLRQSAAEIDEHLRVEVEKTQAGVVLTLLAR
jgi:TonB family protein